MWKQICKGYERNKKDPITKIFFLRFFKKEKNLYKLDEQKNKLQNLF